METMENEIMVSVLCIAFNQKRYIRKCLESLVKQKMNFKYEILVHDDASSDGTTEIIREYEMTYPELIYPIYQTENQYSKGNDVQMIALKMAKGKYIAVCEGDDFWTADDKLQKQIDFLETHQDYSVCAHAAYKAFEDDSLSEESFFRPYFESCTVSTEQVISGWNFATNSLMFRRSAIDKLPIPFKGDCENGDYAWLVYLALKGKVFYLDELMSAYRTESIGSLNWSWLYDSNKHVDAKVRFVNMLQRINSYTGYAYEKILGEQIDKTNFFIAFSNGDRRTAMKYDKLYSQLTKRDKIKLFIHSAIPFIYDPCRRMIERIKMYLAKRRNRR